MTAMPDTSFLDDNFVVTKQHGRFAEFCDAVRRHRYVGVCHGPPGVGKTLSARRYAHWDTVEPYLERFKLYDASQTTPPEAIQARTILYTPKVHNTPNIVDKALRYLHDRLSWAVETAQHPDHGPSMLAVGCGPYAELLLIDEADRLKTASLEQVRDQHDLTGIGVVLIGMPGIERRLARYPQLYSRIGFAHEYQPLSSDEVTFVITRHWQALGMTISPDDFTDAEAIAAVARITGGNFRLLQRLTAQIGRILEINQLSTVTSEVVATAREALIIGS
jgi:DNA transposition AAA+ family ATPase